MLNQEELLAQAASLGFKIDEAEQPEQPQEQEQPQTETVQDATDDDVIGRAVELLTDGKTDAQVKRQLIEEFEDFEHDADKFIESAHQQISSLLAKQQKEVEAEQKYADELIDTATQATDKIVQLENERLLAWFDDYCKTRNLRPPKDRQEKLKLAKDWFAVERYENKRVIKNLLEATQNPKKREQHYDDLIVLGRYVLWLGAKKSIKSVKALEKAMHDACGADWFYHKNVLGPVKVVYLDFENYPAEGKDRYDEGIRFFTAEQRELIEKNLRVVYLAPLADAGQNVKYDAKALYQTINEESQPQVVYVDCLYRIHDLAPAKGIEQREALAQLWKYFPNAVARYVLHHVGRESQDSLLQKRVVGLKELGAERFSNRISDSVSILKEAGTVICQEKRVEQDETGLSSDVLYTQIYGNGINTSPMLRLEQILDHDGVDLKYRWEHRPRLSEVAQLMHRKLQGRGPWKSKNAILKDYGSKNSNYYSALNELTYAGLLRKEDYGYVILGAVSSESERQTYSAPEAVTRAVAFLRKFLVQAMPEKQVRELAEAQQVLLGPPALYAGYGLSVHLDKQTGEWLWGMARQLDDVHKERIRELCDDNPKITIKELAKVTGLSTATVERIKRSLGLVKERKMAA